MKAFMAEHYANAPIKDWLDEFNNKTKKKQDQELQDKLDEL